MRVDPSFISNLINPLEATQTTEQQLTAELSSGVAFTSIGQDPVAASQNTVLMNQISADDAYVQTDQGQQSMLQVTDSAMGGVVQQLTTAVSVAVEGNNGTLNAGDLSSLAQQLEGIRTEVLSMANTSYLGQYVFSGSQGTTQPFTLNTTTSPATVSYNGDEKVQTLESPTGQQVQLNVPGNQVFTASGANVFTALNDLIANFSSGTANASTENDVSALQSAITNVGQQRVVVDNSLQQLTAQSTYVQTEATQLTAAQTTLIGADTAQVATQLSTTETQQSALESVFATLTKSDLFNYLPQ